MAFNPYNWYWLADDGRIFSSLQQAQVPDTDQGYNDFCQANTPTRWPADDAGAQTDASLQAALDPHQTIFANNMYYSANQRWLSENLGITVTGVASAPGGMPLLTDDRSKNLVGLCQSIAIADATFPTTWVAADWNNYALTNAEIKSMAQQLYQHINDCFITYISAQGGERAQIRDMFAKIDKRGSNWPRPKG